MCTTIEVGASSIELLISNGVLVPHGKNNKAANQRAHERLKVYRNSERCIRSIAKEAGK